ncbi:hypothetical protein B0H11DRAFT_2257843 [Mycena galericulata]|nr:hypothetical protein B0H11DRAFT_2257843 [Mycena galericulata]
MGRAEFLHVACTKVFRLAFELHPSPDVLWILWLTLLPELVSEFLFFVLGSLARWRVSSRTTAARIALAQLELTGISSFAGSEPPSRAPAHVRSESPLVSGNLSQPLTVFTATPSSKLQVSASFPGTRDPHDNDSYFLPLAGWHPQRAPVSLRRTTRAARPDHTSLFGDPIVSSAFLLYRAKCFLDIVVLDTRAASRSPRIRLSPLPASLPCSNSISDGNADAQDKAKAMGFDAGLPVPLLAGAASSAPASSRHRDTLTSTFEPSRRIRHPHIPAPSHIPIAKIDASGSPPTLPLGSLYAEPHRFCSIASSFPKLLSDVLETRAASAYPAFGLSPLPASPPPFRAG